MPRALAPRLPRWFPGTVHLWSTSIRRPPSSPAAQSISSKSEQCWIGFAVFGWRGVMVTGSLISQGTIDHDKVWRRPRWNDLSGGGQAQQTDGNRLRTFLPLTKPRTVRRPHNLRSRQFARPIRKHRVACDSKATRRTVVICCPCAGVEQDRRPGRGCTRPAHQLWEATFVASLLEVAQQVGTRTAMTDSYYRG